MDEHDVFDDGWTEEEFGARFRAYRDGRTPNPIGIYTTSRMFDDRFWSMQYQYVKSRRRYELVRGSVRQRAKRKDAKTRAMELARAVR